MEQWNNGTMKKILFLDHTPFIGGAQLSLLQHLDHLNRNRFEVYLGCSEEAQKTGMEKHYQERSIPYRILPFPRLKKWSPLSLVGFVRSVKAVSKLIDEQECHLVVTNTVRTAIVSSVAAFWKKKKLIWFIRDFTFPRWLFKLLSKYPDRIIFNSQNIKQYYHSCLSSRTKGEVVPVGRDMHRKIKEYSSHDVDSVRQRLRISPDVHVIGYTGRLVTWKGADVLLGAIKRLFDQGRNEIKCVIMGTGKGQNESCEERLKNKAEQWGIQDAVVFTGHKKNIAKYLLTFDVLVLPSLKNEPFSSAVVDAMMAGVPVIGTDIGGTPEMIKDEVTGLLFPPGNEKRLAEAINRLISFPELKRRIAKNAHSYAFNNLRADITTEQLERIYGEI